MAQTSFRVIGLYYISNARATGAMIIQAAIIFTNFLGLHPEGKGGWSRGVDDKLKNMDT